MERPIIVETSEFDVSGNKRHILAAYSALRLAAYRLILSPIYNLNQSLRLLSDIPNAFVKESRDVSLLNSMGSLPLKAAAISILRTAAFSFLKMSKGISLIRQNYKKSLNDLTT